MTLNEAIKYFGSKKGIADALQVNKSTVTNWGDQIPRGRQFELQVLTKGKLKATKTKAA